MADIGITKYRARVIKENALPSNPGNPATNPVDPVNPPASGGGLTGVNQFIQLTDTPASYSGATLNYARVNAGETGLEFRTPAQVLTDIGGIGGTIASGQVAFGTGSGTIGGDSGLVWDNVNKRLKLADSANEKFNVATNTRYQIEIARLSTTNNTEALIRFRNSDNPGVYSSYFGSLREPANAGRGALVFGTNAGSVLGDNASERMRITSTGLVGIATTSPTETLDVNGTTRIRTINNLGSTPTEVLVPSATGVVSKRTLTEFVGDLAVVESINAGAGIQVNPNPTASTPQVALTGQALSFHSLTGDGFVYRTSGIVGVRTLTAGTGITITNGDGIGGNPVISATGGLKFDDASSGGFIDTATASLINTVTGSKTFNISDDLIGTKFRVMLAGTIGFDSGAHPMHIVVKIGSTLVLRTVDIEKYANDGGKYRLDIVFGFYRFGVSDVGMSVLNLCLNYNDIELLTNNSQIIVDSSGVIQATSGNQDLFIGVDNGSGGDLSAGAISCLYGYCEQYA